MYEWVKLVLNTCQSDCVKTTSVRVFESKLTGGEAGPLVTASELYVEVGDQSVDVVIPLHLQAEW